MFFHSAVGVPQETVRMIERALLEERRQKKWLTVEKTWDGSGNSLDSETGARKSKRVMARFHGCTYPCCLRRTAQYAVRFAEKPSAYRTARTGATGFVPFSSLEASSRCF